MTFSIDKESERNRLERIAADYRAQGYEVKVQPRHTELPDFLAGFKPDLIVSGKGETIVFDVKTRDELKNAPFTPALEAARQKRKGRGCSPPNRKELRKPSGGEADTATVLREFGERNPDGVSN